MKVTMADIAGKLGITPSAVSLALRDSPKISAKMKRRVKEVAEEMGYHANPYVSALMSSRRNGKTPNNPPVIAFVSSWRGPKDWRKMFNGVELYRGCEEVAKGRGIHLEEFWIGDPSMSAQRLNDILHSRGILGAIFLPTGEHRRKLNHRWENLAVITYGMYEIEPAFDSVRADFYGNMEHLLQKLVELGFTRIGYVLEGPFPYRIDNQWLAAYNYFRERQPVENNLEPFLGEDPSPESFRRWFQRERPQVLICKDQKLIGGWVAAMGLKIPDDVSMVSLGTTARGSPFSGMMENTEIAGGLAMEMLLERINRNQFGPPQSPRHVTLRGNWNPGATIRPPGSD